MFFHGELANLKPAPRYLTTFYLMVSLGGALGGVLIGFVAPKLFNTYYEFGIGLVVTLLLAGWVTRHLMPLVPAAALCAAGFAGYHVYEYVHALSQDTHVMTRNFYGTLRVKDVGEPDSDTRQRRLLHGVIMHGEQYLAPARRNEPTTYYGATSGVGRFMKARQDAQMRVGVIGLGTGTLAAYGRMGDVYRFYEINPQVIDVARNEFYYLNGSAARIETVLGDARLTMEREPPQQYDLLVIDAFSSDSIPVHLITREAMMVYLRHMKPDGVIAFHVTNRFLRLAPVVKRIADEFSLATALILDEADGSDLARTDWLLVTRDASRLRPEPIASAVSEIPGMNGMRLWTDDYNNLFQILK
jgi:SAM-dependent methyltransferase